MTSRKLVKQLESLQSIKPRTEWKDRTREILLAQISAQNSAQQHKAPALGLTFAYTRGVLIAGYRQTFEQLFARPLALSGVLSLTVVAAVSVVVASENSVPGDPLYTVKRTGEQVRVAFVSPQDRATLQLDLADKRLFELSALSTRSLSDEEKQEQTAQLSAEADMSIATAQKELLRLTKETPEKAVRVASQLKERATKTQEQAENAAFPAVFARLDETKSAALAIIVKEKMAANVSDQEVSTHLEGAISELEARLARLQSVRAAGFQGDSVEKAEKASATLTEARESLARNDFTVALAGINRTREIIVEGERSLSAHGDAVTEDEDGLK